MAIVKANYVKRGEGSKERAKATIRYIQERPGKDKKKLTRMLFGSDGPLTRDQVYRMIDEAAKGTLFYRIVISPDPNREDLPRDLNPPELTKQLLSELEIRLKTQIHFAAVEHNDHRPHRHVHVLALLSRKLSKADINFLRGSATAVTQLQRRVLDLVQVRSRSARPNLASKISPAKANRPIKRKGGLYSAPPWRVKSACPSCSEGHAAPMRKISKNLHKCSSCGIVLRQTGIGMEIEQNAGWGREIAFNDSL